MSQTTPPQMEGQLESPNPLEVFWESNKRLITAIAIAGILALVVNYVVQYLEKQKRDAVWGGFATATGLDLGYSEDGDLRWMQLQQPQWGNQVYFSSTFNELVTKLGADVRMAGADAPEGVLGNPAAEPLWIWVQAQRAIEEEDWDAAETRLKDLSTRFPKHFLCAESDFPVQWRKEIEKEETDETEPPKPGIADAPEYEEPRKGSPVGMLLAQIAEQRAFRAAHPRFFEAPEPDSEKTLVLEFEQAGEVLGTVKIRFYETIATTHVARILALAEEGFWTGQCVHEIRREGSQSMFGAAPSEFAFGWPSTRDEDDQSKWIAGDVEDDNVLEWEGGDSSLSHFPGTVAVDSHDDGKSQVQRIRINGKDVAGQSDGSRVIVGRVVDGLDIVTRIIDLTGFPSDEDDQRGTGKPADKITIRKVTIE